MTSRIAAAAHRAAWRASAILVLLAAGAAPAVAQQSGVTSDAPAAQRLRAPLTLAIVGQSLRGALDALRQASGQAYWLERRVDPDQTVVIPLAGPTVADAFDQVAASADLVTLPVDGLVLVGRAAWIDRVGAVLMQQQNGSSSAPVSQPIAWPMLTTPIEALRSVAGPMRLRTDAVTLPHDLWPATQLPPEARETVLALIGAEFDLAITIDPPQQRVQLAPLPEQTAVTRAYPPRGLTAAVRREIAEVDPQVQWTPVDGAVQVRANARAHRRLVDRLQPPKAAGPAPVRPGASASVMHRYTLQLKNVPASQVLATLAARGQWTLQIDPPAAERCAALITLEAEDATLGDLVGQVAQQAGVTAEIRGSVLQIKAP